MSHRGPIEQNCMLDCVHFCGYRSGGTEVLHAQSLRFQVPNASEDGPKSSPLWLAPRSPSLLFALRVSRTGTNCSDAECAGVDGRPCHRESSQTLRRVEAAQCDGHDVEAAGAG